VPAPPAWASRVVTVRVYICVCMFRGCVRPCFTCSLAGSRGVCAQPAGLRLVIIMLRVCLCLEEEPWQPCHCCHSACTALADRGRVTKHHAAVPRVSCEPLCRWSARDQEVRANTVSRVPARHLTSLTHRRERGGRLVSLRTGGRTRHAHAPDEHSCAGPRGAAGRRRGGGERLACVGPPPCDRQVRRPNTADLGRWHPEVILVTSMSMLFPRPGTHPDRAPSCRV